MTLWLDMLGTEIRQVVTPTYGSTRVAETGWGNDQTIVFMHGIGGHLEAYARNLIPLSDRFHTLAFDFVGHGRSQKMMLEYTPLVLVDHLRELLDELALDRIHLSGESLGGWVAGLFAVRYPERVNHLMLNTSAGLPIVSEKGKKDLEDLKNLSVRATTQGPPTKESIKQRMQWLFHPDNYSMISEELILTRLAHYTLPGMKDIAPRVLGMIGLHDDFLIPFSEIHAPTLFLWTKDNPVHDIAAAEAAATRTRHSELYIMQQPSAHWPQYEAPEEFNAVAGSFFTTKKD